MQPSTEETEGQSRAKTARPGDARFVLAVALLAIPVTLIFTYPLLLQWRTHLPGLPFADTLEHAWFVWWFEKALLVLGQSPARLDYIQYPASTYHYFLAATPWSRITLAPLIRSGMSVFAAQNLHVFLTYILTWAFMALLALRLTGSKAGAIVAGAAFTFFANRTMHVLSGHYTQVITYHYPLLALAFFLVWQRPTAARGVFLGAVLAISATVDLMPIAYFAAPMTLAIWLYFFLKDRERLLSAGMLKSLGIGFGLAAIIVIPLISPLLFRAGSGGLGWYQAGGVEMFSADPVAFFVPPPWHPLSRLLPSLRSFSEQTHFFMNSMTESVVYIGWPVIILSLAGAWWAWDRHPDARLWTLVAFVASLLSMGPVLRLAGNPITLGGGRYVMLPYILLTRIPLLSWGRTPARLHFTAMFALAILAAYGTRYLLSRVPSPRGRGVLAGLILFLVLVDFSGTSPWPMIENDIPPFYQTLAADHRPVAVLDFPVSESANDVLYQTYQTVHGHAIVGGRAYRVPPEVREAREELDAIVQSGDATELGEQGIGYIVLHRPLLEPGMEEPLVARLQEQLGPVDYEDEQIIAFDVPGAVEVAPCPLPAVEAGVYAPGGEG